MDERALRFRVGVVVIAAAMITIILITLLGAWPNPFKKRYTLHIVFPEAPGVAVDTPVRKNGIQIGRVSDVELRDQGGVLLTLKVDAMYRLRENEVCRISTGSLITGDAILEFVRSQNPAASTDPLSDGDYLTNGTVATSPFEVIANLEGRMNSAIDSIQNAGDQVSLLAQNLNTVVGDNRQELRSIVRKTDIALDSFAQAMDGVERLLGDPEIQEKLRATLEDLPKLFDDARNTLGEIHTTLDGFNRVSARAERNLANLEEFTAPIGARGEEISANLASTVRNVDQLLSNLVHLSQAIDSREGTLGQLIHNRDLYDRLDTAAKELEAATRKVRPIIDDVRVIADKIARDPRQLGVKGALDRRPNGAGLKLPLGRGFSIER